MATILSKGADFGVLAKCATVTYADTTQTDLFDLPADSYILAVEVDVIEAFSGDGALLDVGKTGSGAYFRDDLDVSAAGRATDGPCTSKLLKGGISQGTRPVTITATVSASNTAGEAFIWVLYITLSHAHLH